MASSVSTATSPPSVEGSRRIELRNLSYFFGPAFVASIAYIDPGNFATNFSGGAQFGYTLLWVLLWSNAMAILIQYLSAKLGIATGLTLPQNCRTHFSRRTTILLWLAAEVGAISTDLAEFLGASLGFYLLFGQPLVAAGFTRTHVLFLAAIVSAICVFLILLLESYGFRKLEACIMGFVSAIGVCYAAEMFFVHPDWKAVAFHTAVPQLHRDSIYLAVSILGATVMPHVVYLHSGLVQPRCRRDADVSAEWAEQCRDPEAEAPMAARRRHLRMELVDVLAAMNIAWVVNSAMLIVAASAFYRHTHGDMSIEQAHATLGPLLGRASAVIFAVALLCSGLSSSTVGTMAGQMILEGFLDIRFSIFLRRLITLAPALIVIGLGLDALKIMLLSQVILSFALPFALIPLLILTGRSSVMRQLKNGPAIQSLGWLVAAVIIGLNGILLWQALAGS